MNKLKIIAATWNDALDLLQTAETMKIFGSTKKLIRKSKIKENVPSLKVGS